MTSGLDFSIVANNADTVEINIYDGVVAPGFPQGAPVILTGMYILWQLFDSNGNILIQKDTSSGIAIVTSSDSVANGAAISIVPADTVKIPQGSYLHEAVTVASSAPVTITDNDPILSAGTAFIRKQHTVWP